MSELKTYSIEVGGEEWSMELLCDTPSQAKEVCKALELYYKHINEPLLYMNVTQYGRLIL
jgi:hypothetical protein